MARFLVIARALAVGRLLQLRAGGGGGGGGGGRRRSLSSQHSCCSWHTPRRARDGCCGQGTSEPVSFRRPGAVLAGTVLDHPLPASTHAFRVLCDDWAVAAGVAVGDWPAQSSLGNHNNCGFPGRRQNSDFSWQWASRCHKGHSMWNGFALAISMMLLGKWPGQWRSVSSLDTLSVPHPANQSSIGIALVLPFTFNMSPVASVVLLRACSTWLVNTRGLYPLLSSIHQAFQPPPAITAIDGYPMRLRGEAAAALTGHLGCRVRIDH